MFGLFNILVNKKPFEEDENRLKELANDLRSAGIKPVDLRETSVIEDATDKEVSKVLVIKCLETRLFAKKRFMKNNDMHEIMYEGLPTIL